MALTILNAKDYTKKLKATIHSTGKLGFTDETAKALGLSKESYIKIAQDDASNKLFLSVSDIQSDEAFKVNAAGQYFYLNTAALFNILNIDYKKYNIMYDLKRAEEFDGELGGAVYAMEARITNRKKEGGRNM